jgi:uncharacterized RDD family membrane protein YckC/Tfp pilus assembly major pilin PilA
MSELSIAPPDDVVHAGFLRRWAAFFVDSLILTSAYYAVFLVVLVVGVGLSGLGSLQDDEPPAWLVLIYIGTSGLYFVMAGLYYALLESSRHQASVGKMALGIKVTDSHGARLSFARALGRWAAVALSYLTLYVGFLMAAFTARKQALHDLVANTLVVDRWAYTDTPERQQRGLSGCLVAFLVGMGLMIALAVLGILAAIAIPAYQDYSQRARVAEILNGANALKLGTAEFAQSSGECPSNLTPGFAAAESYAGPNVRQIELYALEDGRCALVIEVANQPVSGSDEPWIELAWDRDSGSWNCRSSLPDRALPASCRD